MTKTKELEGGLKLEPVSEVIKQQEKHVSSGKKGRHNRFPLFRIPVNMGIFLKGESVNKISPLIHYYNTKNHKNLHCRTIKRGSENGVFVYREKSRHSKELAGAN